jgi:hypothetical protein
MVFGWNVIIGTAIFLGFPFNLRTTGPHSLDFQAVFPVLFPLFFVGMWMGVSLLLAQVGGWSALATQYQTTDKFDGVSLGGRSGRFGTMMNYNGVLNLGVDQEFFHLSVIFLFRLGHSPLAIPWKDITLSERSGFLTKWVVLEFAKVPGISLHLRRNDVLKLKEKADSFQTFPGLS